MASPRAITPLSAAITIMDWISAHSGREPRLRDTMCSGSGLLFYTTYFRRLPGETFSAVISAARLLVSHAPQPRMQACLGTDCTARFVYEGYHFCAACRARLGHDDADGVNGNGRYLRAHDRASAQRAADIVEMTSQDLRAYGVHPAVLDYDAPFEVGISAPDDMVARQMNAWECLSRKRRFAGQ